MSLDPLTVAALVAIGLVGGLVGGLLGIGGSIIFIPAMAQLLGGGRQELFVVWSAVTLITNVFVGAGGAFGHWRSRRIILPAVWRIVPLGTAAAILGVQIADYLGGRALWILFGGVVCYMAYDSVMKLLHRSEPSALQSGDTLGSIRLTWPRVSAVSVPVGLFVGITGGGGGVFCVPGQQMFMGLPQKNSIANSSVAMIALSSVAAVVRNMKPLPEGIDHSMPLILAAILVPPAMIGAFYGGHLTHRLPDRLVRIVFLGFLLWTAYKSLLPKVTCRDWSVGG